MCLKNVFPDTILLVWELYRTSDVIPVLDEPLVHPDVLSTLPDAPTTLSYVPYMCSKHAIYPSCNLDMRKYLMYYLTP